MACRELLVTFDLPRPAMVSMLLGCESDGASSREYLLASTASGLDLHPTSSRRIRDRQSGGTLAHIRTLTGNVVSVAFSWDAGLMEAVMANVRSRCAQRKDAPCCNYAG
jgi:hypothetical protein